MATNIAPLAELVNTDQLDVDSKVFIVRREKRADMANDVGYIFASISQGGAEPIDVVQKFSWVFVHDGFGWRVITDFDGMPADLSVLNGLQPQRVIE